MKPEKFAVMALLMGLGVSVLGDQVFLVAINVWVLSRTHSAVLVSGLWMVPPLAGLVLGSIVGGFADRWDRRRTLVACNLTSALLIGAVPVMPSIWLIYAVLFVSAGATALFSASLASYVKLLVPASQWARVSALRGMLAYGSLVLGPAIAGVLLLRGQPKTAIWLDAGSFLMSAMVLLLLPTLNPEGALPTSTGFGRWREDLRLVGRFLVQHPTVLGVMAGFSVLMIFGSAADAEEVVFATRALHLPQSGYGLLVSTAGIGYVVGSVVSYIAGSRLPIRTALGTGIVLSALSYLLYARSHQFLTAALALIALGIFQSIANVGLSVFLQRSLPTAAMGRMTATTSAVQSGLIVMAVLAGGFYAHAFGVRAMMTDASLVSVAGGIFLTVLCLGPGSRNRFLHPVSPTDVTELNRLG